VKLTDEQKIEICDRYRKGESGWRIAKDYPVTSQSIYSLLKCRKVQLRSAVEARRKLSSDQQLDVLGKYNKGVSSQVLAEEYGVDVLTIQRCIKRAGVKLRGPRKYHYDVNFFDHVDCERKAYWLGLLYADGWVGDDGFGLGLIDQEHIKKFKEDISATYKIERVENEHKGLYVIRINDRLLVEKLRQKGLVKRKSKILELPSLSSNVMHHFMRGYFDGDGHFSKAKHKSTVQWQIGFTSGSLKFLEQIRSVLRISLNRNIGSLSRGKGKKQDTWSLLFNGNRSCNEVAELLYRDATVVLDRKHAVYLEMLEATCG
jgi:uncharacterized protein (DUF433 family)